MSEPVVVFDSGAIEHVVTNRELRAMLVGLLGSGWTAVIPTPVLAEAATGTPDDSPANQAIRRVGTTPTDESVARRAGALRHAARRGAGRRAPSAIDAIVAAHATEAGAGVVITTDPDDLRRLLADHPRIGVERP